MVLGVLPAGAAAPSTKRARKPAAKTRPNILLVTLDTTRQDAIGCYRDPRKEYPSIGWKPGMASATPTLDALCAKGRRFTRAYTTAPITLVAHASILTGLYPPRHGVHDNGIYTLPVDVPTLPEILKKNGYQTGAAVSAVVLDRHYGLNRGFDQYDDKLGPVTGGLQLEERKADKTVDAALKIVNGFNKAKPFFFWLHLYDPHNDYQAPEPYKSKFPPYLAEVAFMDHELGRFLDAARKSGRINNDTLIVVTADHGESLGEHGEETHGVFLYESSLKVPMILAGNQLPPGVLDPGVSIRQIMPTILARLGIEQKQISQVRLLDGYNPAEPGIYAESELGANSYHWAPLYSVIVDDVNNSGSYGDSYIKLISAAKPELYDVLDDPGETSNLLASSNRGFFNKRLEYASRVLQQIRGNARASATQADDPAARAALQQLGYISGPTQADDKLPRPDPKDVIHLLPKFDQARGMAQKGNCAGAIPILSDILMQNPGNVPVTAQLGWCRIEMKEPRAAVPLYAQAIKLSPSWEVLHYQLGVALDQIQDGAGAEREWRAALALNPRYSPAAISLAGQLRLAKKYSAAADVLRAARAAGLDEAGLEFETGVLAVEQASPAAAETAFKAALRLDPAHLAARTNLSHLLYQRGAVRETLRNYEEGLRHHPGEKQFLLPAAAVHLQDLDDAAGAVRLFNQFLRYNPTDPEAQKVRAIVKELVQ